MSNFIEQSKMSTLVLPNFKNLKYPQCSKVMKVEHEKPDGVSFIISVANITCSHCDKTIKIETTI